MNLPRFLGGHRRSPPATAKVPMRLVRARFDAAQTSRDNIRHWSAADYLSADAEANADVRQTLRMRARYEVANNSYAKGIVLTLANDSIGTGPHLQLLTEREELNRQVEADFAVWANTIGLAEKLRTLRIARCQDGEGFAVLVENPRLASEVTLDIQLVEADRVTDDIRVFDPNCIDGITFDAYGNPTRYRVLKQHPGSDVRTTWEAVQVPAKYMIHVFRSDRPGLHRGVPEITPALPLFAQLRRFTLAVLTAAEAAADFAGILYTDAPASGEADEVDAMDAISLERNMLLTMPSGWKMDQVDPKQPATTYAEFKHEILNEIARCLNMPYNIAAGNSSGYNYASGRLDHQTYYRSIKVDQGFMERTILNRIFEAWFKEYALVKRLRLGPSLPPHGWIWDGTEHVDPTKEASAQTMRLANLTTTLAAEYAKQGKDWEAELHQIAREHKLCEELGIPIPNVATVTNSQSEEKDDER